MIRKYVSSNFSVWFTVSFFCLALNTFAQTDICNTPTALTVGTTCNTVNYSLPGTFGNELPDSSCRTSFRDGWYIFTTGPTMNNISIDVTSNGGPRVGIALYSGAACTSLVEQACDGQNDNDASINVNVTPGTTYRVRIMRTNNANTNTMSGSICIYGSTLAPSNDTCANSFSLIVNTNENCSNSVTGSTIGATDNNQTGDCTVGVENDVWYQFRATSTQHVVTVRGLVASFNPVVGVLTTCGSNTRPIGGNCTNVTGGGGTETLNLSGLTIGNFYRVQVYDLEGDQTNNAFNICVTTPYDPCSEITTITTCGTNINLAIPSGNGIFSPGNCGFATPGKERILSFTPTVSGTYRIEQSSSFGYVNYFARLASACSNSGWICLGDLFGNNNSIDFGLTAGTTYQFLVDTETTGGGNINFTIACPPPVPENDQCTSATTLFCGDTNIEGTTIGSTDSPKMVSCGAMSNYGVWYTFAGTGEETIITVDPLGNYDIRLSISEGSCDNLTGLVGQCVDNGTNGNPETYTFDSEIGKNYYIYIAHKNSNSAITGDFLISLTCCERVYNDTPTSDVVSGIFGTDGDDPEPVNCALGNCFDLEADFIKLGNTGSYRVEQIPYNPPPTGTLLPIAGLADDTFSATLALPWAFCFYGTSYSNFVYGANGVISFDTARLQNGPAGFLTNFNIPSLINASDQQNNNYYFGPSIFGVHQDIDPSRGSPTIGRRIDTTPGKERMIIVWQDVPMWQDITALYSGKMVLYKNTNVIEIYVEEKRIDGTWNDGNASIGLQKNSSEGVAAPCRNALDPNWTVTSGEAWRFVPDEGNITELKWYANTGSGFNYISGLDNNATPSVCPTETTTYRAEVTYSPACGTSFTRTNDVVIKVGDKIWNGSVNTNWFLADNWTPSGVPIDSDCIVIPEPAASNNRSPIADYFTAINGTIPIPPSITATAKNLRIRNNSALVIKSGTILELADDLIVEPNGDVLIESTASLVQSNVVTTNGNVGSVRMQRTVSSVGSQDYVYWSSPVEDFDVRNINLAGSEPIYTWSPTTSNIFGTWLPASGTMAIGTGYIVRGLATPPSPIPASTAQFTGRPNNGIINVPIYRGNYTGAPYTGAGNTNATNLDDNWNLIGNPYPSAISANEFLIRNASGLSGDTPSLEGTVYLWRHLQAPTSTADPFYQNYSGNYFADDYIAYNLSGSNPGGAQEFYGNIGAGQSFFVLMDDAVPSGSTVRFDNAMRLGSIPNDQFYRYSGSNEPQANTTLERHRIWLDLMSPSDMATSTLVAYIEGATDDKDRLYDGHELSDSPSRFYSLIGDEELSIQGRSLPFNQDDSVPLGIIINTAGSYDIAINALDGLFEDPFQGIFLEDTYTAIIHDLRIAPYTFSTESGTFNNRFILRYNNQVLGTSDETTNSGLNIVAYKEFIKVTSNESPIDTIQVYDVLGRLLADYKDINSTEFKLQLSNQSKGALIVKASRYDGHYLIKKVIQ